MDEERLKKMQETAFKALEEAGEKHPDIKELLKVYKELTTQSRWSKDFLDGYYACISDLNIIKKMQ